MGFGKKETHGENLKMQLEETNFQYA